jgi:hypothetical protein
MIKLLKEGRYRLSETKHPIKILVLDDSLFAWEMAEQIGELLITTAQNHPIDSVLSRGPYRLYEVEKEAALTNFEHLELFAGDGHWQGYLLLSGLPTEEGNRHRIIATNELITKSHH